ncbi:MAG TPA: DUF222 domain-containing protein [Nitriliruptorales bacterium]
MPTTTTTTTSTTTRWVAPDTSGATAWLAGAVDGVAAIDLDELDEAGLRALLGELDLQVRRLRGRCTVLAGTLADRRTQTLRDRGQTRADQRGARDTVDELRAGLGWSPAQATSAIRTHRGLATLAATRQAMDDGRVTPEHARVLADTLDHLAGSVRAEAQARLLEAATREDPVAFGRTCRRLLGELDPAATQRDADRRRTRRFCRTWTDEHGVTRISGAWSGIDAETLLSGIDAFRTQDPSGTVRRNPQQATADAVTAMARAALDHGVHTTSHGSRPHIHIIQHAGQAGAEGTWTGPLPPLDVDLLAVDARWSRTLLDDQGAPTAASTVRQNVSAPVWRALVARDRHCTFPGCDAPPGWCDAAHLDRRVADGAPSRVQDLALACRPHHRQIDRLELIGQLIHGQIVWHRPHGGRYQPPNRQPPNRSSPDPPGPDPPGPDPPGPDPP